MFSLTISNATEYINSPARRPLLIQGKKIFPTRQSTMMCPAMSTTAHVHSHSHVLQGRTQHLLLRTRGERHSVCWLGGWGGGSASRDLAGRTQCQQRPRRGRQQDLEAGLRVGGHLLHRYSGASDSSFVRVRQLRYRTIFRLVKIRCFSALRDPLFLHFKKKRRCVFMNAWISTLLFWYNVLN